MLYGASSVVGLHQTGQSPEIVTVHGNVDEDENAASRLLSHLSLEVRESKVVLVSFRLATLGLHFRHCCFCFFCLCFCSCSCCSAAAAAAPVELGLALAKHQQTYDKKQHKMRVHGRVFAGGGILPPRKGFSYGHMRMGRPSKLLYHSLWGYQAFHEKRTTYSIYGWKSQSRHG